MLNRLKLICISALIISSCTKDPLDCYPSSLRGDILAAYTFTNGSLEDSSPNKRHLEINDGAIVTKGRSGDANCAYRFNFQYPSFDQLIRPDASFLDDLESFTVSGWYKLAIVQDGPIVIRTLVSRDSIQRCPDREGQWSLALYDGFLGVFGHTASVWSTGENCENDFLDPKWIHLAGVKDVDSIKIYCNGVLEKTKSNIILGGCTPNLPPEDIGALTIGRKFDGDIDDITIFGRALRDEEIQSLYNQESCCD